MNHSYEEIECKFLEVDPREIKLLMEKQGIKPKFKRLFRRYVFDYPDLRLNTNSSWLRIRDEGERVTLSFKQRLGVRSGHNDEGMKEIELIVDDFDKTAELFKAIGLKPKFYEENWRTLYDVEGVEVVVDEWPLIPPYVEIEGESWDEVERVAVKLGFDFEDRRIYSTMQVYEHYGINEADYRVLTFDRQERAHKK